MSSGFHDGELAVQRRAGVSDDAARLVGMLDAPDLDGGAGRFLRQRTFAVLTARDAGGTLWTSALTGPAGFLDASDETSLLVHAVPRPGDPLAGLPAGQPVGMLAIDFAARRRLRVNGVLADAGPAGLRIEVDQAYGNCPKYIRPRDLVPGPGAPAEPGISPQARRAALVAGADTFFLGTVHPTRGTDASHRGGPAGFVRFDSAGRLVWFDYPGNNMFNSFGNLAVDPTASLLFVGADGATLHLSGTAEVEWVPPGARGDLGGTGRRVVFTPSVAAEPPAPLPVHEAG